MNCLWQWILNHLVHQNHLENLLKQINGPHLQSFWFIKSGVWSETWHFLRVPRWYWCCSSREQTLRNTGVKDDSKGENQWRTLLNKESNSKLRLHFILYSCNGITFLLGGGRRGRKFIVPQLNTKISFLSHYQLLESTQYFSFTPI